MASNQQNLILDFLEYNQMRKIILFGLFLALFPLLTNAYAEKTYVLSIDEHSFDIVYDVDGDVLAIAIDPELTSLLVGLENTRDSEFTIDFPKEMISAENDAFAILVNGLEVDYQLSKDSNNYELVFFVLEGTEEVEIIGTHVIPEFPFGALFGFVLMTSVVLLFKKSRLIR